MRKRTFSRECALKILYRLDITKDALSNCLEDFWLTTQKIDSIVREFAEKLVLGVTENLDIIDGKISNYATNWQLKRMAIVDRNILRIGSYELIFLKDIPPKVTINEAVELAKRYSTQEASKFVNGILDKIKKEKNQKD